jgi:hypothetical protein
MKRARRRALRLSCARAGIPYVVHWRARRYFVVEWDGLTMFGPAGANAPRVGSPLKLTEEAVGEIYAHASRAWRRARHASAKGRSWTSGESGSVGPLTEPDARVLAAQVARVLSDGRSWQHDSARWALDAPARWAGGAS